MDISNILNILKDNILHVLSTMIEIVPSIIVFVLLLPIILVILFICIEYIKSLRFKKDYSNTHFINITGLRFMPYALLPKDKGFFKETLHYNDDIFRTKLPTFNMNDYDFDDVPISSCIFTKNTILPKDKDFFQKIKNKSIVDCALPSGDYSKYDFTGVKLNRVIFTEDSIIPLKYSFFKELYYSSIIQAGLPKSFKDTCHLYDLSNVELHLDKKIDITDMQKAVILNRNKNLKLTFVKNKQPTIKIIKRFGYKLLKITI